jgi:DNA-directed RNA polymerase subunit M/transcription elongation factor TFIIS
MRRNNEERAMAGHKPASSEEVPPMANPMDFVAPTEWVELPSKGRYPEGHPLHGKDSIEIRYMTAKDEDILTSRDLLKKGLAIDRLISNLIKDKTIDGKQLYVGDRNAIMLYARVSAYGADYKTKINCPNCGEQNKCVFNLQEHKVHHGDDLSDVNIKNLQDGTFEVTLPMSSIKAKIRPLIGYDELEIIKESKGKAMENLITKQMKRFVLSFNDYEDAKTINYVCDNMVATDSRYLRDCFMLISPDISVKDDFECKSCGHEEAITVPFGADFFWPER